MSSSPEQVLLLGDPRLRAVCAPVTDFVSPETCADGQGLVAALEHFRSAHGFGRAIAAPQIGIQRRMIAMNLGRGPFVLINPELSLQGSERFTMWDDCMSFPWLMVRLERHSHVHARFWNEQGDVTVWTEIPRALAELLQHEVDHLDGILALDHALDRKSIIARAVYEERREFFDREVDYAIMPTLTSKPSRGDAPF